MVKHSLPLGQLQQRPKQLPHSLSLKFLHDPINRGQLLILKGTIAIPHPHHRATNPLQQELQLHIPSKRPAPPIPRRHVLAGVYGFEAGEGFVDLPEHG